MKTTQAKYGKLTPIKIDDSKKPKSYWICLCDCGKTKSIESSNIKKGKTVSCGCYNKEMRWKGYQWISGYYWNRCIRSAKIRNLEFNLTIEQAWDLFIKQEMKCALSGRNISFDETATQRKKNQTASLDRIDSSIGYVISNVCWLHKDINYLKSDIHTDTFIAICQEIVNYRVDKAISKSIILV